MKASIVRVSLYLCAEQPTAEELERDFKASARTSIARKVPSAPLKLLLNEKLLTGSVLNYGKGKYDTDSKAIREQVGHCVDYDYTYCKKDLRNLSFSNVVCMYVLNTLPLSSRKVVWAELANVVRQNGSVFVAVRSDKDRGIKGEKYGDGVITSIGTFQIGYEKQYLLDEAALFFSHVKSLKSKSGFYLIQCSHSPI
ncbi:hypothetical protein MACH09_46760 [Vibrio sp. MACH09]|uniref:hypothetical protein n=1 Tax=Vibrio sp. MACH09 TaxID=3025122 RepID=UPI00278D6A33|nr:hypothetical protein [Vibrio sp. MACH09]GLO64168.1 hypothetical protein MACH09_46760 [Vibrio sp. MACH09]